MSERDQLYNNPDVWVSFYRERLSLENIGKKYNCDVYELSPWLYAPLILAAFGKDLEPLLTVSEDQIKQHYNNKRKNKELEVENEKLKAQVEGLSWILLEIKEGFEVVASNMAADALSKLPSDWLEEAVTKEEVARAAANWVSHQDVRSATWGADNDTLKERLFQTVEALQALQKGGE